MVANFPYSLGSTLQGRLTLWVLPNETPVPQEQEPASRWDLPAPPATPMPPLALSPAFSPPCPWRLLLSHLLKSNTNFPRSPANSSSHHLSPLSSAQLPVGVVSTPGLLPLPALSWHLPFRSRTRSPQPASHLPLARGHSFSSVPSLSQGPELQGLQVLDQLPPPKCPKAPSCYGDSGGWEGRGSGREACLG